MVVIFIRRWQKALQDHLSVLHVVLLVSSVRLSHGALGGGDSVNYLPYDCQDNGCDTPGSCDFTTGKCTGCDADTHDYACRPITLATCNAVGAGCAVGDAKLDANTDGTNFCTSATQCACAEGLIGADCTTKTLDVTCAAEDIDITVNPHPTFAGTAFSGKIFLSKTRNIDFDTVDVTCQSSGATSLSRILKTAAGGGGATCNDVLDVITDTGGGLVVYVYVQQRNDIRSSADQFVRVSCMPAVNGGLGGFTVESALDSVEPLPSTIDSADSGMTLSLKKQVGSTWEAITANLQVADDISIVVEHNAKFYLRECRVSNYDITTGPDLAKFRQMWLIREWCVPKETELLYRNTPTLVDPNDPGGQTTATNYAWRLDLEAFYFVEGGSNQLFVTCYVCDASTQADCQPDSPGSLTCDNDFYVYSNMNTAVTNAARRRRSIQTGQGSLNTTLSVHISVESGVGAQSDGNNGTSATTAECYKSTSVLLPIILLAVLLLVSMVMTFFFCMNVTHDNQQPKLCHENMGYKS